MARPEKINIPPKPDRPKRRVRDDAGMPAKYLRSMAENKGLKACCRKVDDMEVETLRTATQDRDGPDQHVFTCASCGRRHWRSAMGAATIGR